jgi:hypothetical protein
MEKRREVRSEEKKLENKVVYKIKRRKGRIGEEENEQ